MRIIPARAGFTHAPRPATGIPAGSSPLARGLLQFHGRQAVFGRIIPARAGFTGWAPRTSAGGSDHPRSRGVYALVRNESRLGRGSSPLARGLLREAWERHTSLGIIPARAGFTLGFMPPAGGSRDHPRSRGVYDSLEPLAWEGHGSSPLARGLRPRPPACGRRRGIIPARAGFTYENISKGWLNPDHPRSRGVYPDLLHPVMQIGGSSPLARGLRVQAHRTRAPRRIIPARAGFTRHHRLRRPVGPGSSPLARGLPVRGRTRSPDCGIIPARAGFTHLVRLHGRRGADHPRSRGVYP